MFDFHDFTDTSEMLKLDAGKMHSQLSDHHAAVGVIMYNVEAVLHEFRDSTSFKF